MALEASSHAWPSERADEQIESPIQEPASLKGRRVLEEERQQARLRLAWCAICTARNRAAVGKRVMNE